MKKIRTNSYVKKRKQGLKNSEEQKPLDSLSCTGGSGGWPLSHGRKETVMSQKVAWNISERATES